MWKLGRKEKQNKGHIQGHQGYHKDEQRGIEGIYSDLQSKIKMCAKVIIIFDCSRRSFKSIKERDENTKTGILEIETN